MKIVQSQYAADQIPFCMLSLRRIRWVGTMYFAKDKAYLRDCLKSIDYEPNVRQIEPIVSLERELLVLGAANEALIYGYHEP